MPKDLSQNFSLRHIGPRPSEIEEMLEVLKLKDLGELVEKTIPESIHVKSELNIGEGLDEFSLLKKIKGIASKNKVANFEETLKYTDPNPFHFGRNHSSPSTFIQVFF